MELYNGNTMESEEYKYADGWRKMMVTIWLEKIREYDVIDTGALMLSFKAGFRNWMPHELKGSIVHEFLYYGIYVERGTGRGMTHGNGGDVGFAPTRIPRPWMSKRYMYSVFRFQEHFSNKFANDFCRILKETLESSQS